MGGGTDGYRTILSATPTIREHLLRLLERRPLGPELELARQRLERQLSGAPLQVFLFSSGIFQRSFILQAVFASRQAYVRFPTAVLRDEDIFCCPGLLFPRRFAGKISASQILLWLC